MVLATATAAVTTVATVFGMLLLQRAQYLLMTCLISQQLKLKGMPLL